MFDIEIAPEARRDLAAFRKYECGQIISGIEQQLTHEPMLQTRHRKRLRPNEIASWELRIGRYRVLYNVEESERTVHIVAIGFKMGNLLYIRGERRTW